MAKRRRGHSYLGSLVTAWRWMYRSAFDACAQHSCERESRNTQRVQGDSSCGRYALGLSWELS